SPTRKNLWHIQRKWLWGAKRFVAEWMYNDDRRPQNFMIPSDPSLEGEILSFYNKALEPGRLKSPFFQWENIRTLDLMDRFLLPAGGVIVEAGGGAGAYAFPLAEKGYVVDLIDPVPLHIEQARNVAGTAARTPRSLQVGDARAISADDGTADAVLFFGPLYH